ncbi:hypothetical protein SAMN05428988_3171 [Chitinophaga sp. YR573]|uniref:hypothetical protein n=1 Tax=Chitinophaga sp. YR573 TaxID=1881040 RepID=UPI0008BD423D|nr:hypothetical protein [Chitinophaga sp. YR573]SEW21093.1 hypothetical protein SAMN05428988_3171 [Chitinophaga sp. YR573]
MPDHFDVHINISYNYIFVIQSLPSDELPTGKRLYDDIIRRRCELRNVESRYFQVDSKDEFFSLISRIVDGVLNKKVIPILHFEMHGDDKGFQLANGELGDWEELALYFRQMNVHLKNGLLITLGVCEGIYLYQIINPIEPAPFWGIIGPKTKIANIHIEADFTEFYNTLLSSYDFGQALKDLNLFHGHYKYAIITCDMIWQMFVEMAKELGRPIPKEEETRKRFLLIT